MLPTPPPLPALQLPLSQTLSSIFNLSTPLTYKKLSTASTPHLPRVLIFGDVQNGKSTLGNYILRESIIDKNNLKTPKGGWLPTKRQSTPVTTQPHFQNTDTLFLIDTPGFNNPSARDESNQMNSIEILDLTKSLFSHKTYLNGLIFSIMVKKSLVIEEGSIMTLYNMLISFGLENVDLLGRDFMQGQSLEDRMPFVKVVVNNFSRGYSGVRCESPVGKFWRNSNGKSPDSDRRVSFESG